MLKLIGTRSFLRRFLDQEEPVMVTKGSAPRGLWIPIDGDGNLVGNPQEDMVLRLMLRQMLNRKP